MGSTSLNLLGGQTDHPQDPPGALTLAATVQNVRKLILKILMTDLIFIDNHP